jgi:carbonic anhydrase/acetyltransferase-like protein (isoleucine patch superfamily)
MIREFEGIKPKIDETCFVAETSMIIGDVVLEKNVNVWYGTVIRGDVNYVRIGENTNVQDNTVVHVDSGGYPTIIGKNVTIGHGAIIHACEIGDNTLIGMGAIVLDGAEIGENVILGAGALVPPGKKIPSNCLAVGSPAKVVRELGPEEVEKRIEHAERYVKLGEKHK